ncbi:hypothetical protein ACMHYB_27710 [Sorangium sp. So ce1128]
MPSFLLPGGERAEPTPAPAALRRRGAGRARRRRSPEIEPPSCDAGGTSARVRGGRVSMGRLDRLPHGRGVPGCGPLCCSLLQRSIQALGELPERAAPIDAGVRGAPRAAHDEQRASRARCRGGRDGVAARGARPAA